VEDRLQNGRGQHDQRGSAEAQPVRHRATDFAVLLSLVAAGAGVSRQGGDRKPAVRVVLDSLAAAVST
jgi:hypothetical protein